MAPIASSVDANSITCTVNPDFEASSRWLPSMDLTVYPASDSVRYVAMIVDQMHKCAEIFW